MTTTLRQFQGPGTGSFLVPAEAKSVWPQVAGNETLGDGRGTVWFKLSSKLGVRDHLAFPDGEPPRMQILANRHASAAVVRITAPDGFRFCALGYARNCQWKTYVFQGGVPVEA